MNVLLESLGGRNFFEVVDNYSGDEQSLSSDSDKCVEEIESDDALSIDKDLCAVDLRDATRVLNSVKEASSSGAATEMPSSSFPVYIPNLDDKVPTFDLGMCFTNALAFREEVRNATISCKGS